MNLNIEEIKKIIPHREPFLLIDCVSFLEPGKKVVAFKKLKETEFWFKGHFPNYAVQPGVLTIEMLAQAGAVCVLSMKQNLGKTAFFAGIDKARFKNEAKPNDELKLEVKLKKIKGAVGVANACAFVKQKLIVSAELMFVIKSI